MATRKEQIETCKERIATWKAELKLACAQEDDSEIEMAAFRLTWWIERLDMLNSEAAA